MIKEPQPCLTPQTLDQIGRDEMPHDELVGIEEHVTNCSRCRDLFEQCYSTSDWCDEIQSALKQYEVTDSSGSVADDDIDLNLVLQLLGPSDDPQMLGRIGAYEVTGVIGRGGMGVVFKAFDSALDRFVAIKMMSPHLSASGAARKRFIREGKAAAAVIDDHVMPVYGVDQWQGVPYLVMQYSRGESLHSRLKREGSLDVKEILRIGMQVARGLAAAHSQGLVHRDVKPSNVLLCESVDRAVLSDFGLARAVDDASMTVSGTIAGTPQFMSPEQVRAERVDQRSDLFSLGSLLYSMCTGHPPFRAESSFGVMRMITDSEPRAIQETNADIPGWLCQIIRKLMARNKAERFESAAEVADLLEACLAHVQQPTISPLPRSVTRLVTQQSRRHRPPIRKLLTAAAMVFPLILAGVLIVLELNKGTLTIESDGDDIPIRIVQGDEIVRQLVVGREGTKTRLRAGQYTIVFDDPATEYTISDSSVIVRRGETELAKITHRNENQQIVAPVSKVDHSTEVQLYPLREAIREFNNLHSSDAQGRPQSPLTISELRACLHWKMGNDQLSYEVIRAIHSILYTRERLIPEDWHFTGGLVRERCEEGVIDTWEVNLNTNGLCQPIAIRRTAIAPPLSIGKPTEGPDDDIDSISLEKAVGEFNASLRERNDFDQILHRVFIHGLEESPLTIDELLAGILLCQEKHINADSDTGALERLQRIAVTHRWPSDVKLEFIPSIENAIGQWFDVSSIRILVPHAEQPEATSVFTIRKQFIETNNNNPAATHWGTPGSNGIQAGFRFVPAQRTYEYNQAVDLEFLYRSVTGNEVPVKFPQAFSYDKVTGIRLLSVDFDRHDLPDYSAIRSVGADPVVITGHRMQVCIDPEAKLKDGVNLRAITKPAENHYVRFTVPNPGVDAVGETLEINDRILFNTPPLTPPPIRPLFTGHYYLHWGIGVPGYRRPEESTPDPKYIDPFMIGMSLGPADKSRIPTYFAGGLEVTKVAPYSPAQAAGIEVGDIVLSWDGHQIYGDDPAGNFLKYRFATNKLSELQETWKRHGRFMGSSGIRFVLLDHRTDEVIDITPWFGVAAGGGYTKSKLIERARQRKRSRDLPNALLPDLDSLFDFKQLLQPAGDKSESKNPDDSAGNLPR